MPSTRINLEQGSLAWHAWRKDGIGASEAAAILHENPWKSRATLLAEKCGRIQAGFPNAAMAFGTATEPAARDSYSARTGIPMAPVCLQSTARPWQRASLDGLSADGSRAVEIKCGEQALAVTAKLGRPPPYYVGQLQHILAVSGLDAIDFWCYLPGRPSVLVTVARDEAYIGRMLLAEAAFWAEVVAFRAMQRPVHQAGQLRR